MFGKFAVHFLERGLRKQPILLPNRQLHPDGIRGVVQLCLFPRLCPCPRGVGGNLPADLGVGRLRGLQGRLQGLRLLDHGSLDLLLGGLGYVRIKDASTNGRCMC